MPNYDDPRLLEILTPSQMEAIKEAGYMLVPAKEVREIVKDYDITDDLIDKVVEIFESRIERSFREEYGYYHLRNRIDIFDGVYVDPDIGLNRQHGKK
ncbi:hypothetical protein [Ammoniphilus resinae]|uniref:Uncharacterized protein n=1 Tax=Ammoniphilus resinae TaxID=861532 RepID=A0ABS4GVL1_9BACL|nr:hypothetical protein [Ammoniphilus resinae]MBP1934286.1 hypothetical protein [Ammoniphilus resinae]